MAGYAAFCAANNQLLFGPDSELIASKRCATVQCISGSGALRVGAEFLARHHDHKAIHISDPSWSNHYGLFPDAGLELRTYRYYDAATISLDLDGMLTSLEALEPGTPVLFQVVAHNPTGIDPRPADWRLIVDTCVRKKLLPFLDSAYIGFASGCLETDAGPIRLFAESGLEFLVATSYSKNMGLYAERAGALTVVCGSAEVASNVLSQLKAYVRLAYSMPPKHGAAIVQRVLEDPDLTEMWMGELREM